MFLDYKNKFDTTQTSIKKELTDRRSKFTKREFGLALGKGSVFQKNRPEISGTLYSISQNHLEDKNCNIFRE